MASDREYLHYVLEQCPQGTTYRRMMGEFLLYYRDRLFGGIYDNRVLIKPVRSAIARMPSGVYELPYEGAKPMLLVDTMEDRDFLEELLEAMYPELPPRKKK